MRGLSHSLPCPASLSARNMQTSCNVVFAYSHVLARICVILAAGTCRPCAALSLGAGDRQLCAMLKIGKSRIRFSRARAVVSVRKQRRMWNGYGAYNPAVLQRYLEIYLLQLLPGQRDPGNAARVS